MSTTTRPATGGPPEARDHLLEAWRRPPGVLGWLTAVNHKAVGLRFIVTAFAFLLIGGVLALLIRLQLAVPGGEVLSAEAYNEVFTMHGTTMMFLFAVPVVEGLAIYLLPLMLGTRDLPFPRLNAFGYWSYLFGGLFVYASFLAGDAPSEGWFAYVPLSDSQFAPGDGMEFWLLGVTFVEISGIVGAIELISGFVNRRAIGMSLSRIPLFGWAAVVMAVMMLVAFPALVAGSVLLEMERTLGTHFFDPAAGGDPLLWQHLFWFFGHPEVYIMFVPATGIVSMVVPALCGRRIAGYTFVVAALVAIGLVSFGLWVHHMFAVGLPLLALGVFSAASFVIAVPSGIQIFAWLTTMWRGRPSFRTPLLFVLGFVVTFVVGGITGVMVAAAPFDLQVHDSFFVVAHFHYVLIGGVLFPVFGGLYYWFPKWSGRALGERLGQASFWTMLLGFNLAFFPQHFLGFEGMPRRIFTYSSTDGWSTLNMLSTVGAFLLAAGIALTVWNVALSLARGRRAENPWRAGSLEWEAASPPAPYNFRRLPVVASADPLWDDPAPEPSAEVRAIVEDLATPGSSRREAVETSPLTGEPRRVVGLPGPSPWPLVTALAILLALVGTLIDLTPLMVAGIVAGGIAVVGWAIDSLLEGDVGDVSRAHRLPRVPSQAAWWAVLLAGVVALVIVGAFVFGYLLFVADAAEWPPEGVGAPAVGWAAVTAVVVAGCALAASGGSRAAAARAGTGVAALALAALLAAGTLATGLVLLGERQVDLATDAYGSIVFALLGFGVLAAAVLVVLLALAVWQVRRSFAPEDRVAAARIASLGAWYLAAVWAIVLVTVYVVPRVV